MSATLLERLDERVLVLDGGVGTELLAAGLDVRRDFRGLAGRIEVLNLERPDAVRAVHAAYLAAGCDAIETNTFRGSRAALAECGLDGSFEELNRAAVRIACEARDAAATAEHPRFVLGALGPGAPLVTLGQTDFDAVRANDREHAAVLVDAGVDALLVETRQGSRQLVAGVLGAHEAVRASGRDVPILASVTLEVTGRLLSGEALADVIAAAADLPIELLALNCALGPRELSEHVRELARGARTRIGVYPNAGLPQFVAGEPCYPLTPAELADWLVRFAREDGARLVGGCCGTTPAHMRAVVRALGDGEPVARPVRPARRFGGEAPPPKPPFLGARVVDSIFLQSVLPYVNRTTLFHLHWGVRRTGRPLDELERELEDEIEPAFWELARVCAQERVLEPRASYGYWRCRARGDELALLDQHAPSRELVRLRFPRERGGERRCVADAFSGGPDGVDVVALLAVTLGERVTATLRAWYAEGRALDVQRLQGLAAECTGALAEHVHRQIRGELGIAREDVRDPEEFLNQGYRGSRYALGSAAWPDRSSAAPLLELLEAERVGITADERGLLRPEASSLALVCHQPTARYFVP